MDGLKRYVNDDRFRVDGDKNMRLLAFAFTIVFVWTGSNTASVKAPSTSIRICLKTETFFIRFQKNTARSHVAILGRFFTDKI